MDPAKMEKILLTRHYPKWETDVEIKIVGKKEEAAVENESASEELRIYLDGSAVEAAKESRRGLHNGTGGGQSAAIKATKVFSSQEGHYLMDIFHDDLRTLIQDNDGRKLVVRWTPGHIGIASNKAAGQEHSKGSSIHGREPSTLPQNGNSKSQNPSHQQVINAAEILC
ncbi:hypothetical protein BDR05DRAFT_1002885 [Suillus weaverae]|nr:hypothetical protein BDR05DRAFT_1002885 [Suillus weaverae]